MKNLIAVPPVKDPMMLSIMLSKVHTMAYEDLFIKDGKFWMRCPSDNWSSEHFEQIEAAGGFYSNSNLPFSMLVEPGGIFVFKKATNTIIAQQRKEGNFIIWDYINNNITIADG